MKKCPGKHDTVSVYGLGRSGMATVEHFVKMGACVYAYDDAPLSALSWQSERLSSLGVPLYAGETHELRGDFVFRSPVLRPDLARLCRAALRGSVIWGEAEYFAALSEAPVYAVTGSDGKTTTASLLSALLERRVRRVYLGGNIGRSLLPFLSELTPGDAVVLELSSFQLMDFSAPVYRGVLTNLSPNHLNWHRDMDEYAMAKRRLLSCAEQSIVRKGLFPHLPATRFSLDGDACYTMRDDVLFGHGVPLCRTRDVRIAGRHNLENLLAAVGAAENTVSVSDVLAVARSFSGVAHRLEWVREVGGVQFYNSSIDTTPTRTAVSVCALDTRGRLLLLLGGRDKGLDLSPMLDAIRKRGARAYLFGEASERLACALGAEGLPYTAAGGMEDAVRLAYADAHGGDAVLLSPGCTSFDAYRDFEARGECFRRLVRDL